MRYYGVRNLVVVAAVALLLATGPRTAMGQALDGTGLVPTGLLLRQMDGVKRVLMIGAHPDDEDTPFLAVLARGMGVETAYLSLTRGDGGQNLIGPELWEGLGVIRTGELEAARALDGGKQFFTRAFDYGYSKTSEEALTLWPREELLSDVVWIIRKFRPQVVVSVWSGTPRDGHGQHQASGIIAQDAFEAAGDPSRFPEQLALGVAAWTPAKLYMSSRRREGGTPPEAQVVIQTGGNDPLLGRSTQQLSALSRSQHRSQDMGSAQPLGPRTAGAILMATHVEGAAGDLFAGIDTTLAGLASGVDATVATEVRLHLEAYRSEVAAAQRSLGLEPAGVVPILASALRHLSMASTSAGPEAIEFQAALAQKVDLATRALMAAAGIVWDVRADDDLVVPGQVVEVQALLWNGSKFQLALPEVVVPSQMGSAREIGVEGLEVGGSVAPESLVTFRYAVTIPEDQDPSRLYFLREARDGARYRWPDNPEVWGLPRDEPSWSLGLRFTPFTGGEAVGGRMTTSAPWRYVGVDQARGEFVKPVLVVPAVSVRVTPAGLVWPESRTEAQTVTVSVRSQVEEGATGEVALDAPEGWSVTPTSQPFDFGAAGAERTLSFEVRPSGAPGAGEHVLQAVARTEDGRSYTEGVSLIDYEHIERSIMYTDAATNVTFLPVSVTPGLHVGYIMGTGDDGPLAIKQMGAFVELLSESQVRDGAFGAFDVIVLGVRAYETRPDVRAANEQLLDFARAGGTVINQYNQDQFSSGGYAPYALTIGRPTARVADETAVMTILEPDAPLFTTPNQITQADFSGWVQERGLYFASEWADDYVPMLSMNDPGEDPLHGSVLVASVGEGIYVYAALSFFRQWAGQVPGAYRLFANLISLDAADWADFVSRR